MFTLTWLVCLFTLLLGATFIADLRRPKDQRSLTHPVMRVLSWLNLAAMAWCGVYWSSRPG